MKKALIIALACLLTGNVAFAQYTKFSTSGTIEFEKTLNMFAIAKRQLGRSPNDFSTQIFEAYKKTKPQFKKLHSTLVFGGGKSLFTPVATDDNERLMGNDNPATRQFNTVFADLEAGTVITEKQVYEDTYLLKDTLRKINWKLTDETREIAGYMCRRANAVIMDSVYVVAFYTSEIHVSSGPEQFSGLPGMILGVALPHENVTWFATKVTDAAVAPTAIMPPKKGKPVNTKQLTGILSDAFKNWSNGEGPHEVKIFTL